MKNKTLSGLFMVGALALSSVPVAAGVVTYTSSTGWTPDSVITFTGMTAQNYQTPVIVAPIAFQANNSATLTIGTQYGPGTGNFIATFNSMTVYDYTNPNMLFGLGFNLECYSCAGSAAALITITDSSSTQYSFSAPVTASYFGFTSSLAVSSVTISYLGNGGYVALDDVGYTQTNQMGGGTAAPEAATMVLIGSGLAMLARLRKYAVQSPCHSA